MCAKIPTLSVTFSETIKKMKGRTEFQRGILYPDSGNWLVEPTGNQGSGILNSMVTANCFIVLDEDVGSLEALSKVKIQILNSLVN